MMEYLEQLLTWLGFGSTQILIAEIGLGILAVGIALWVVRRIAQYVRSLRPSRINPTLAKYAGDDDPAARHRRQMAALIKSTSSTSEIPGYKILQAVEALYVEGFRTPGEAIEGLKAAAAERGANALINVRHERSSLGRCSASGDAVVVVETTGHIYTRPSQPIDITPPPTAPKTERKRPDGPMIR